MTTKTDRQYQIIRRLARYGRNVFTIMPLPNFNLTNEQLIIELDDGNGRFGGHIDRNVDGTLTVNVYID